jgi:hypothetical protein
LGSYELVKIGPVKSEQLADFYEVDPSLCHRTANPPFGHIQILGCFDRSK